jgi:hypothetical protein
MSRKYYGFEFWDSLNTTTGEPNQRTKRMSIAGDLKMFKRKTDRDAWKEKSMRNTDRIRIALFRGEVRQYHLGMSTDAFNEMLDIDVI